MLQCRVAIRPFSRTLRNSERTFKVNSCFSDLYVRGGMDTANDAAAGCQLV